MWLEEARTVLFTEDQGGGGAGCQVHLLKTGRRITISCSVQHLHAEMLDVPISA